MKEEKIIIDGKFPIGATITHVDDNKKLPAVVIIMGTGKTDRDGNVKNFKTNLYSNLASDFAEMGFVSLRYDKRGTFQTGGDYNTAGLYDLTDDALSVIRYAKTLPYVDENKIIVCGHSEGGMIATLISDKEDTAGLMILGAAGCNLQDALHYQNRVASRELCSKKGLLGFLYRKVATEEKNIKRVDDLFNKCALSNKDKIFFNGATIQAKWMREHFALKTDTLNNLLHCYQKPILAITGTADLSADYTLLETFKDDAHITTFAPENVNHLLREIDDNNSILTAKKQYLRLSKNPVQKETANMMKDWLGKFL